MTLIFSTLYISRLFPNEHSRTGTRSKGHSSNVAAYALLAFDRNARPTIHIFTRLSFDDGR
jgi:hypothetical protein